MTVLVTIIFNLCVNALTSKPLYYMEHCLKYSVVQKVRLSQQINSLDKKINRQSCIMSLYVFSEYALR